MKNLGAVCDHIKAVASIPNSGNDRDMDAILTLEGLVVSSRNLDDESKLDLLEFLESLLGASCSRQAMRRALRVGQEEGVW